MHRLRGRIALIVALQFTAVGAAHAIEFDFESPAFSVAFDGDGKLAGQGGWTTNAVAGAALVGYVDADSAAYLNIDDLNPIHGAQSIRYQNLIGGLNDHGYGLLAENAVANLSSASIDLVAELTVRAETADLNVGFFIGEAPTVDPALGVLGGSTPMLARLFNGSIQMYTGAFSTVDTYNVGDIVDLRVEADLDGQTWTMLVRNVTQGDVSFAPVGATVPFSKLLPNDGVLGQYDLGMSLWLRRGTAAFDSITFNAIPEPSSCVLLASAMAWFASRRRG